MEEKNNKTFIYVLIGIIGVCLITIGLTYAYWILTREQTGENVVNTACLNITFTGENDITLDKAYPLQPAELEKFLSTAKPYHFTIHNECSDLASASINLESLTVSEKALEDDYIDAILYEDDYNTNLNTYKKLTENTPNDDNKVIEDAKHSYSLYNFTLKPDEERDFNLLLYMDADTPMVDANMNATWKGKITLSTGYQEDSKALRKISSNDTNGMWGYKDKLTKIVIEDTKNVKTADNGGKVYGPFDESEYGTKAVESYVVCEADDTNCVGYLQSNGKVIANSDSSHLFLNFNNVIKIDGLDKLDTKNTTSMMAMFNGLKIDELDLSNFNTSNVTNMSGMFGSIKSITILDLSSFDMSKVTNITNMFNNNTNLTTVNLSKWKFNDNIAHNFIGQSGLNTCSSLENLILNDVDTSEVTNMSNMFAALVQSSNLTTLNLSSFNTSKVTNMNAMFGGSITLQTIELSSFDTKLVANMESMFGDCINLQTLDLNNFDTSKVENMSQMFRNTPSLQHITFGSNFVHNQSAITGGMFQGCSAPERPTGDTWSGVSF